MQLTSVLSHPAMLSLPQLLRRLKPAYALYNVFQRGRLRHNVPHYRRLGLGKRYYSSVSSADFADLPAAPDPTVGEDLGRRLEGSAVFASLSESARDSLLGFPERGYAVLGGFFDADTVAAINADVERLAASGEIVPKLQGKYMFVHRKSAAIREAGEGRLRDLVSVLFDHEAHLFQSLNFLKGSQQPTHSDSLHMSTYPHGGLVAAWVALEDIHEDSGPIHYYPGSHRLPYYMNGDYGNEGGRWLIGGKTYKAYEAFIEERARESGLEKRVFTARAGDVFLWHANLLHGGEVQVDMKRTRKSMVFHYFSKGCVLFHEVTQRPALVG